MGWSHLLIGIVLLVVGYYIGSKYPGLLSKTTGGMVSA